VSAKLAAHLTRGEHRAAVGLTRDHVDFLRRTLRVDRQLVTRTGVGPLLEAPKASSSFRTVPLAAFVVDALAAHIAKHGLGEHDLILHQPDGRPVDSNRFGAVGRSARKATDAPSVDYHDCRRTFASILLSQGVSVKAVADWLGHASPVVTLEVYSHLMPVDEDRARTVIKLFWRRVCPICVTRRAPVSV
jgi:integrase